MRKNHPLKRSGLENIRVMDKVQKIDPSNTAPSSKTFRDELIRELPMSVPVQICTSKC
jgi:hypothetical protein